MKMKSRYSVAGSSQELLRHPKHGMDSITPATKKASEIAALLELHPHPDGGFYLETFRDSITLSKSQLPPQYKVDRAVSSAIYFLLPSGSVAHLHRIPCAETWHYYIGEPLTVFELQDDGQVKLTIVGPDLEAGHRPQYTVPPNVWFDAFLTMEVEASPDGSVLVKTHGREPELHYSLVGVTCAPAFQFEDNELACFDGLKAVYPRAKAFLKYFIP